jgi:hypothetical protein
MHALDHHTALSRLPQGAVFICHCVGYAFGFSGVFPLPCDGHQVIGEIFAPYMILVGLFYVRAVLKRHRITSSKASRNGPPSLRRCLYFINTNSPTQPTAPIPSQSHTWVFRPVSPSALEPTILCAALSVSPAFCSHRHAGRQQQHCSARFYRLMRYNSEVRTRMDELFKIQHEDGVSIPTFSVGRLCF